MRIVRGEKCKTAEREESKEARGKRKGGGEGRDGKFCSLNIN